ncbi:MAG: HAMP domain-containing histidine kinase [Chloroflexi bacterium]|nr:HAMP domain-containing histidine kinase [Chloroflexota bacterium]MBT7080914.1 HAMP domain-containing histidine kinase [Chloroflexota bacterium]MBT7289065.1 HAMP domain-containing histidine kinase [Chloroflexota bacterium]
MSEQKQNREQLLLELDTLKKRVAELEMLLAKDGNELLVKASELERANIELKEADRMKSIFIANMSHELRTPLNSIMGFTGLVLQGMAGELNEAQKKQLEIVKENSTQLLNLITEILDLSQIEAGMLELAVDTFTISDLIEETLGGFASDISAKKLKLLKKIPYDISLTGDKRRIAQIIINLLSNAVKYTQQGTITVTADIAGNSLKIIINDTGIGMKQDYLSRVFSPFQQVEMVLIRTHSGTGLGLYLSKKLATLMGGDITAKSKYGTGSEFTYTTPIKIVS